MEIILNLIRKRYCYQRTTNSGKIILKIIDRAYDDKLIAIIYDFEVMEIVMRYLNPCR